MAREKMDFAQQNTERAMQGTEWMRAIAEQNLNQGKAALEEFLTIVGKLSCWEIKPENSVRASCKVPAR
jgi:hypothetical protein